VDLDAYRRRAESFSSELTAAYYRHYAGLDREYRLEPVYARHAELFTRGAVGALQELALAPAASDTDEHRRRRILLDFALEGHIGQLTKGIEAELAGREVTLFIEVDGQRLGLRESSAAQANEPSAARRQAIERERLALTETELGGLHRQLIECQHATARELGYAGYRQLCAESKEIDLAGLHEQTAAFSAATDGAYTSVLDPELRRTIGIGVDELQRSDLPRFFRAPSEDRWFAQPRLVPSFIETMRGLGIDAETQAGVVLDLESRPHKTPRAFCAPVVVPGQVYLVLTPIGGREDFSIMFHEAGHAEHFAHIDPGLAFEFRYLGDQAVTEAFAFLFQHLIENPAWLQRRLGIADSAPLAAYARASRLIYLRRYAAKLAYELELHGGERPLEQMRARYSELLGSALGVSWSGETYLSDVDPGFYCAAYLRAWALEAHLRAYLIERFGAAWFEVPEAGERLRGMWRDGTRLDADELLGELTGDRLDFGILLADLALDQ
jgi:hypothetical protein